MLAGPATWGEPAGSPHFFYCVKEVKVAGLRYFLEIFVHMGSVYIHIKPKMPFQISPFMINWEL